MCPESGKTSPLPGTYSGKKADIWALGITLFCFTFKTVPFDGENVLDILSNIEEQKLNFFAKKVKKTVGFFSLEFPKNRVISKELQNLMEAMLKKNPFHRKTLEYIKTEIF